MARRKRKALHPLLREIVRRQREIAKLLSAAKMIGLDVSIVIPASKGVGPKKAAAYYAALMANAPSAV